MNALLSPSAKAVSFLLPYTSKRPSNGPRRPVRVTVGLMGNHAVVVLASTDGFNGPTSQSIAAVIEDMARALFDAFQADRLVRGDWQEQQAHRWLLRHWRKKPKGAALSTLFNDFATPGVVLVEHVFPGYASGRRHSFMMNTFDSYDSPLYHRPVYEHHALECFGEAVSVSLDLAKGLDFLHNP